MEEELKDRLKHCEWLFQDFAKVNIDNRKPLKDKSKFLTRDAREVESGKIGLRKARRSSQFKR